MLYELLEMLYELPPLASLSPRAFPAKQAQRNPATAFLHEFCCKVKFVFLTSPGLAQSSQSTIGEL